MSRRRDIAAEHTDHGFHTDEAEPGGGPHDDATSHIDRGLGVDFPL
jgi:hypothetical protein